MTLPEIQNDPYFMGNHGQFHLLSHGESKKIGSAKSPMFTILRTFSCHTLFSVNQVPRLLAFLGRI